MEDQGEKKPSEPQTQATQQPAQPVQQPKQSGGGWGSSLWSSFSTYVDVNTIAQGITTITTQSLDKVYEILEPPKVNSDDEGDEEEEVEEGEEKEKGKEKEKEDEAEGESSEIGADDDKKEKKKESTSSENQEYKYGLFTTIGSVFESGIKIAETSIQWAEDNVHVQELGENVLKTSLETLEAVGKKTMDTVTAVVNETGIIERGKKTGTIEVAVDVEFNKEFENKAGSAHIKALEMLSKDAQLKIKAVAQILSADSKILKKAERDAKSIVPFFNIESASNDIENSNKLISSSLEGFEEMQKLLTILGVEKITQIEDLKVNAKKSEALVSQILVNYSEQMESVVHNTKADQLEAEIGKLTSKTIKQIKNEAVKSLATLITLVNEQFLRTAESILISFAEKTEEKKDPIEMSKACRELCIIMLKDTFCVASVYVRAIEQISSASKPHFDSLLEEKESEAKSTSDSIYVDTGDGVAICQDSLQLMLPIFKLAIHEHAKKDIPIVSTSTSEPAPAVSSPVTEQKQPQETQEEQPKSE